MLKRCRKKVAKQTCIYLYFHFNFKMLQKYSDINKKNNHLFETKRILQPKVCLRNHFWLRLSSTVNLLLATSSEKYARYNIFFSLFKAICTRTQRNTNPSMIWGFIRTDHVRMVTIWLLLHSPAVTIQPSAVTIFDLKKNHASINCVMSVYCICVNIFILH